VARALALIAVGAAAAMAVRRTRQLPRSARVTGAKPLEGSDDIEACWTDERLDSAEPDEGGTVDPQYLADLAALHRRLPWLPEAPTWALLDLLLRLKRLLPVAERYSPGRARRGAHGATTGPW